MLASVLPPFAQCFDVMGVAPARVAVAPGPGAVSIPGDQGPSQGGRDDPGAPADIDDLAVRAEHDPTERAVAGESSEFHDGEEMAVLGLVEPTGDALEGRLDRTPD